MMSFNTIILLVLYLPREFLKENWVEQVVFDVNPASPWCHEEVKNIAHASMLVGQLITRHTV